MDRHFGQSNYSLRSLFRDEQRGILDIVMAGSLQEAEALYRQIYEHRAPMMRFITDLNIPLPKAFHGAAEFVLNGYLRRALEQDDIDTERIRALLEAAMVEGVALDTTTLEFAYRHNLERLAERLTEDPTEQSPPVGQRGDRTPDSPVRSEFVESPKCLLPFARERLSEETRATSAG